MKKPAFHMTFSASNIFLYFSYAVMFLFIYLILSHDLFSGFFMWCDVFSSHFVTVRLFPHDFYTIQLFSCQVYNSFVFLFFFLQDSFISMWFLTLRLFSHDFYIQIWKFLCQCWFYQIFTHFDFHLIFFFIHFTFLTEFDVIFTQTSSLHLILK